MWNEFFTSPDYEPPLDQKEYSFKQKRDMVETAMTETDYFADDDEPFECHNDNREEWTNLVCLCPNLYGAARSNFNHLNDVIPSQPL
jgi:hypothetical protein